MLVNLETDAVYQLERHLQEGWRLDVIAQDGDAVGLVMKRAGELRLIWPGGDLVTGITPAERVGILRVTKQARACHGSGENSPSHSAIEATGGADERG